MEERERRWVTGGRPGRLADPVSLFNGREVPPHRMGGECGEILVRRLKRRVRGALWRGASSVIHPAEATTGSRHSGRESREGSPEPCDAETLG